MKKEELAGRVFGLLTVTNEAPKIIREHGTIIRWNCRCECGQTTIATTEDLKRGHTQSCGCYQRQKTSEAKTKHGLRKEWAYHRWLDMKQRCHNPHNKRYNCYGGRGISICKEWEKSFKAYFEYVSKLPHYGEPGYSIDRINNDGNYEPGNVRWATAYEQVHNRRRKQDGT